MTRGLSPHSQTALLFLSLAVGLVACADPQGDYDDYVELARSHSPGAGGSGGGGGGEGGSAGSAPTDFNINGKFIAYCLASLGNGNPAKSLLLATEFKQEGTNLQASLIPLLINAKTLSDTAGTAVSVSGTFDGPRFTLNFGTVTIPGVANAISGSDIEVNNTTFLGLVQSNDKLCAELEGDLVKPFPYSLNKPSSDVCIILRANPDGSLPERPGPTGFVCGN